MPVTLNSVLQIVVFLVLLLLLTRPMGLYLTNVFAGERNWLTPVLRPVERVFYRLCGINPAEEQSWTGYVIAMLVFSVVGMLRLSYRRQLYYEYQLAVL
jgi:K+-transporting ATPase ATPase A chain